MSSLIYLLALACQLSIAAGPSAEDMRKRFDDLSSRYRTAAGVDTARMTAVERKEFFGIQAFFRKDDLLGRLRVPADLKLTDMPKLDETVFSTDLGGTYMPNSAILATQGPWSCVGLMTDSLMAVPAGWEIYEGGTETHLVYPPCDWTPTGAQRPIDPRSIVNIRVNVRSARSVADVHESYKSLFGPSIEGKQLTLGDPVALDAGDGRGYFVMVSPQLRKTSVVYFAPDPAHSGEGFVCMVSMCEERWAAFHPAVEAMLSHWYTFDGRPLGAKLDFASIVPAAKIARDPAPTTQPTVKAQ